MSLRFSLFVLLMMLVSFAQAQLELSVTQSSGLKAVVINQKFPALKILLPDQPALDRGIEIEFPEHVTAVDAVTRQVKQFYLITREDATNRTVPKWRREGKTTLVYETAFDHNISMTAKATLEPDGLRYVYEFKNRSKQSYINFQAVTCVQLYSVFSDTLLQRTYVHHSDGFDLLASESPERLTKPEEEWLPCRYLVSYNWSVNAKRIEKDMDGITRYNKSRKADKPFIAAYSHDKSWIAATYTKETGNLWSNPERSCQHVDPAVNLKAGETKQLELKTFVMKGTLDQLLVLIDKEQRK